MKRTKGANFRAPRNAAHTAKHTAEGATLASLYMVTPTGYNHYSQKIPTGELADTVFGVLEDYFVCTEGTPELDPYSAARLIATLRQAAANMQTRTIVDFKVVFPEQRDDETGIRVFGACIAPTAQDSYCTSSLVLFIGPLGELSQRLMQLTTNPIKHAQQGFKVRGRHVFH